MRSNSTKPFIIVSGLPASGKTTLARQLAPELDLSIIDKDEILERLLNSRGTGDASWRRALGRESDVIFQREAAASNGAVLVSFWRLPGMSEDSGTPSDWVRTISSRIIHVHCVCTPEVAAERFQRRKRHAGHLDSASSYEETLDSFRHLVRLCPLDLGSRIDVDTSGDFSVNDVVREIRDALG